jgi:transposase
MQTVRNAIHAFEQRGLACLKQESCRPKTVQAQFDQAKCEALRALLHQSPRTFGKATSQWTLELAAKVCFEQGLTGSQVSIETIRQALGRLGVGWQRAKNWITSPDPAYARKKKQRDTLIALAQNYGWEVGYLDEVWWSRVSQPNMHSWSEQDEPLRLHELIKDKTDPDPQALACYGMLEASSGRMLLRFVSGRPVSQVTIDFLEWLCVQVQAEGKGVLVLIWDNASWHGSHAGQNLAPPTQSDRPTRCSNGEIGGTHYSVLVAHQESVAQSHRAEVGSWQASHCRASPAFNGRSAQTTRLRLFWM